MTFRIRVAILAASAVAIAALGAAAIMYVVVQDQLNSQLNQTLIAAATQSREADAGGPGHRGTRMPPFPGAQGSPLSGRPDIGAQLIESSGRIGRVDNQPVS